MPFIDEDKLAALYKEVDQEKKAAAFFQNLHQEDKAKLLRYSFYRLGCFIAFALLILGGIYFFTFNEIEDDTANLSRIEQLELENKILGGTTKQLQDNLKTVRVYTVQFMASSNNDILLFSDHFVNFRAYPLQDFNAYSLGNFATEEEAEAFLQE
ncbi:MAG: hypothetical protein VW912_09245, partial [Flavobacteriaceae bacterium]